MVGDDFAVFLARPVLGFGVALVVAWAYQDVLREIVAAMQKPVPAAVDR
jgi:hypothetical protein